MPGNCQIPTPEAYVDQMLDYKGFRKFLWGGKYSIKNSDAIYRKCEETATHE